MHQPIRGWIHYIASPQNKCLKSLLLSLVFTKTKQISHAFHHQNKHTKGMGWRSPLECDTRAELFRAICLYELWNNMLQLQSITAHNLIWSNISLSEPISFFCRPYHKWQIQLIALTEMYTTPLCYVNNSQVWSTSQASCADGEMSITLLEFCLSHVVKWA